MSSAIYEERYNAYVLSKRKNARLAQTGLDLFLQNVIGFPAPKGTSSVHFLTALKDLHIMYGSFWQDKLGGLTGGYFMQGGEIFVCQVIQETPQDFLKMYKKLKDDFSAVYGQCTDIRKTPDKFVKSKIAKMTIDELWSLRYAHELVRPWTKSDEEINADNLFKEQDNLFKEQQDRKQEKKRLQNQRKKQKEKKKKVLEAQQQKDADSAQTNTGESLSAEIQKSDIPVNASPQITTTQSDNRDQKNQTTITILTELETSKEQENPQNQSEIKNSESVQNNPRIVQKQNKQKDETNTLQQNRPVDNNPDLVDDGVIHWMDKKSHGTFQDLFEHREVFFDDFCKAFQNGLGGEVYKNKGGSMITFVRGKYSFVLHRPHKGKGRSAFYDKLTNMAIKRLETLGITKDTIQERKKS